MSAPVERGAGDCPGMDVDDIIYASNMAVPASASECLSLRGFRA